MTAPVAKPPAIGDPGDVHIGAVPGQIVCALEGEIDGQRGDQRAGGEGEHAGQHLLGRSEDRDPEAAPIIARTPW